MNSLKKITFYIVLLVIVGFSCPKSVFSQDSSSQKMINILPDDVLFFAVTSGEDVLKPEFDKTIIGRIFNDPNVKTFYASIEKAVTQRLQKEPRAGDGLKIFEMAKNIGGIAISRPIIVGAAQKNAQSGPPVYGFAFMDAGDKKGQISGVLSNLEAIAGEGEIVDVNIGTYKLHGPKDNADVPGYWGWVENYLVFAINDSEGLAIKYLNSKIKREQPVYFQKSSITNDVFAAYINVQKGLGLLKSIAKAEGKEESFAQVESVLGKLGISQVKTITGRTDFEGAGIVCDDLIEVPQPVTGLFASFKTINQGMLNMVEPNAVNVSVINCDIGGIYDTVFNTIKSVAGADFNDVERGIAEIEKETQIKIRQGLLESLNGQMVFYNLPGWTGLQSLQGGFVCIAGLKNAKLWQESIDAVSKFAAANSNGVVQVSSQIQGGRTLNTIAIVPLAMSQIMPTWTIVGDNVVIGSSPAICSAAAEQAIPAARAQSIRNTEGFRNATAKLPENLIYLRYSDSKVQLTQMMAVLQQLWPVATMYATQQGITLPVILPDLTNIIKNVMPSIQYSWFDNKGLHSYYKGTGIEPTLGGAVAGGAVVAAVALPALVRTRQAAYRMVAGTNLSKIGKAMMIYANDYQDFYPPNLEVLVKTSKLDPKVFESRRKPANFNGPTYIYIADQNISMDPKNILVYENPGYCTDGINVLFLDSHVEWMTPEKFMAALKETYDRLKRRNKTLQMPEIKFKD